MVDDLVRPNPDDPTGRSMMRRVPEVLDCWFESGSMPFAQVHYPFENREWFEDHYPGDFIVEYIGQTRGWFYTLHVLATALFDRPAFRTCVSHGIVLGDDGQKMSKTPAQLPRPDDGVRHLRRPTRCAGTCSSSSILRGGDLMVTEDGIRDTVRQVHPADLEHLVLPHPVRQRRRARSARSAPTRRTCSTATSWPRPTTSSPTSPRRWTPTTCSARAPRCAAFLDALTNWYVRRSRDRFWAGEQDAIDTLHTVLALLCRTLAPLLPLTTEAIYRDLTGERSVHLTDWPTAADAARRRRPRRRRWTGSATCARRRCGCARPTAGGCASRSPTLTVAVPGADRLLPFADLIADEVNVKHVDLTDDVAAVARYELQVVPAALGPRLGEQTQQVIKAVKAGDWTRDGDTVAAGGIELRDGEYSLRLRRRRRRGEHPAR